MATRFFPNKPETAIVPMQEILPAASPFTERQIIDQALTAPRLPAIFRFIEQIEQEVRAIMAWRDSLDVLRGIQAAHIQARYGAELELDLGRIVEEVRHKLALIQIANQKMEMDWAAEMTVEASKIRIALWVKFGEVMRSLSVMPAEQVDRMVMQYITMEVAATTTRLATTGGIDGVRRPDQGG